MKFYRLHQTYDHGSSVGYVFFMTMASAEKAQREWLKENAGEDPEANEIDTIEVKPTRAGILAALNQYADHPDNG